jgi:hypothetical protein
MMIKDLKHPALFAFVFAIVFVVTFIATPVIAPAVVSQPGGGTITVVEGGTFTLSHVLRWDQPDAGRYIITIAWNVENVDGVKQAYDNFTFVEAKVEFISGPHAGEPIENIVEMVEDPLGYTLQVRNATPDPRNGDFRVDIVLRATGAGGVLHLPDDDHPIEYIAIDILETDFISITPPPITIRVLPRIAAGVEVSISPNHQSGTPSDTLTYTILVVNMGLVDDVYDLTVSDNMGWRPSVSPTSLMIPAGESKMATLSVFIPPDAKSGVEDKVVVKVTSRENAEVSVSATCVAHVIAETVVRKVEISISPRESSGAPGATLNYVVNVRNIGDVEDFYTLEVLGAMDWSPHIEPSSLAVAAGKVGRANLKLIVPSEATDGDSITLMVIAKSRDDPMISASDTCKAIVIRPAPAPPFPLAAITVLVATATLAAACALNAIRKYRRGRKRRGILGIRQRRL